MNGKISLIEFNEKHITKTFKWVSDAELQRLFLLRGPVTWSGHQSYFERILVDTSQKVYAIFYNDNHIGNCGYKNISIKMSSAELWIYLGEKSFQGKGIGKASTQMLLLKGFLDIGLEHIYLHAADFNIAALKLYKNFGFVEVKNEDGHDDEWKNRGCRIIKLELSSKAFDAYINRLSGENN